MSIKVETIGEPGCEVSGGFSHTEIYVALVSTFASLTEPKDLCGDNAATTLEELVTITTAHTFNPGYGFTKMRAIQESVGLETTQIGDTSKSPAQENKLTVQLLGSKPELLGFKRQFKGKDLIVLAPEFGSGNLRQIGSAKFGAKIFESSSKIEATVEGENTTTLVFRDKQKYDAPIYSVSGGGITLQPAS